MKPPRNRDMARPSFIEARGFSRANWGQADWHDNDVKYRRLLIDAMKRRV